MSRRTHGRSQVCRARLVYCQVSTQFGLALLCLLVSLADGVRAQGPSIQWVAPSVCPSEVSFVARVKRSSVDGALPAGLSATAQVTEQLGLFRANVQIRSAEGAGERTLEHTDCSILADSVALVIALSTADGGERPAATRGVRLSASAHAAAVSGTLPRLAFGAGLDVAAEGFWSLRTELSASLYLDQTERFAGSQIGARFRLVRLAARVCRVWNLGKVDLAPCLGAQLHRIAAYGSGGAQRGDGAANLLAPTLGVFARLRLFSGFFVRLVAELAAPIERRRFVYTDLGLLHQPDAVAGQLFFAPEVQF